MGQLCDAGCIVAFDAKTVTVRLAGKRIMDGLHTPDNGLWQLSLVPPADLAPVPIEQPPLAQFLHQSFAALNSATPAELVAFAHATLFSNALSTLATALTRGFLPQFIGLTAKALRKHPPVSIAKVKGHLDQSRKNQRSTKTTNPEPHDLPTGTNLDNHPPADTFPISSDPGNSRWRHCFAAVVDAATGQIHSDQTGKFIVASSAGHNYILVVYDYDKNGILLVEPLPSRTCPCIRAAFKLVHERLVTASLRPQLQRLDNECSAALKTFLRDAEIDFQLVPPRAPSPQCRRTCDSHVQKSLHCRIVQCG